MASVMITSLVAAGFLAGSMPASEQSPLLVSDHVLVMPVQQGDFEVDGLGLEDDFGQPSVSRDGYDPSLGQSVVPVQARDASCMRAARQAVEMTGGEVLSVVPARSGRPVCKVTVLVIKANGRPKRIKLRIPMDY